jgi:hypothetical protein
MNKTASQADANAELAQAFAHHIERSRVFDTSNFNKFIETA